MKKVYTTSRVTECELNTSYYITGEEYCYLVISTYGNIKWCQNGKLHRDDGPAVIYNFGRQIWYQNGKYHRVDGPAVIDEYGYRTWWQNDKLHRVDGPALITINEDGEETQEWWVYGDRTTKEKIEFLRRKYFYRWRSKMNF